MCDPAFQIRHNNGTQPLRRFAFLSVCVGGGGGGVGNEGGVRTAIAKGGKGPEQLICV